MIRVCLSSVLVTSSLILITVMPVKSQNVYVDLGNFGDPLPPSSAFSAAAPDPGVWNRVAEAPAMLVDTTGTESGIAFTSSPSFFTGFTDNASTNGDVGRLLDDNGGSNQGLGATSLLTVSGLEPSLYAVYFYAWRSIVATSSTASIDVNGVGPQIVEPMNNEFVDFIEGENYSYHEVTIDFAEDLNIEVTVVDDVFEQVFYAGFQIVDRNPVFGDGFETIVGLETLR